MNGDGAMANIATQAECKAVEGSCIHRDSCNISTHVFQEGCGGDLDGCCISKETVCESKNGTFTTKSECETKSGFRLTGLHLDGKDCCAPYADGQGQGQGDGSGKGQGNGDGKGQGNGDGQGQGKGTGNGSEMARLSSVMYTVFVLVCSFPVLV